MKTYAYENAKYPVKVKLAEKRPQGMTLEAFDPFQGSFYIDADAVGDRVLRVRLYRTEFLPPYGSVVNPQTAAGCPADVRESETSISLDTGKMRAEIGTDPFSFCLYGPDGALVYQEQTEDVDSVGPGYHRMMPVGYEETEGIWNICARLRPDEHIFGLGERFTEFDKRGQEVRMWNKDTLGCRDENAYKNIPFYLSSRGYGLFVNSVSPVEFQVGTESTASVCVHVKEESLEYYLIAGENPKEIVQTFTNLTGPAQMPPKWSFGLWYSVGFKGTDEASVLEDAEEFRRKQIPCDVFHFDCYWLRDDMWCDFVWDDSRFPHRMEMLRRLKEMNYRICLWMNPYVTVKTGMYAEGKTKGYFAKDQKGEPYLADLWHGLLPLCAILDVTNEEAVRWFEEKLEGILAEGVDVLKTDFGEDIPEDCLFSNGKTGAQMRNIYSGLYNRIVYDTVKRVRGEGLVWARSGGAGMQRYPVCWSGDPRSCWEGMAGVLRAGLSLGVSGVPFWSHDMGGFYGEVSDEVYVRWCQFGLFSSHSRLHGTTARQPWAFSEEAEKIVTDFVRLRYRLMPYILEMARECADKGEPLVRPLFLEDSDDPTVWNIWDEYYFGDSILAAPVFGGDMEKRMVYLPKGNWTDLFTGKQYEGARWHRFACPLWYMPVFIKEGGRLNAKELRREGVMGQ